MNITIDFDPADKHDQMSLLRLTELVTGKSLTAEVPSQPEPPADVPEWAQKLPEPKPEPEPKPKPEPKPEKPTPEPEPKPEKPSKPSAKEIRDAMAKAETLDELKAVEDQYGQFFTQAQRKAYSARVEKLTPEAKEDEAVAEPVATEPTLETAVKRASELLGSGQADRVKAALAELDAPRVSKLKPNQVQAFLDALED